MGTILQEATRVTCDARVGEAAGHFGFAPLWCNVQRGLRSYTDVTATVRRFCPRHEAVVRSRYPEAQLAPAPGCYFCHRTAPILDGTYTAIDFGPRVGIQHVCDDCNERADEEPEIDFDNREGQPEFNGAFR